jgi:hypothetical protein
VITPKSPPLDQKSPSAAQADTKPVESGAAAKVETRSLAFNFETQRFETKMKSVSTNGQSALDNEVDNHVKRLETRANMLAKDLKGQEAQPRMVLTGKVLHS